jgi:hypothetical protein
LAWYEGRKLSYALGSGARARDSGPSSTIAMPNAVFGKTKIGEIYGRNGLVLTAYIPAKSDHIYVSPDHADREDARVKLGASITAKGWEVHRGERLVTLKERPLAELELKGDINQDDGGVLKGWICTPFEGNVCVNLFDTAEQKFTCSIKTPKDGMNVCRPFPGETCAFKWSTGAVTVYQAADCRGQGVVQNKTLATCQPV